MNGQLHSQHRWEEGSLTFKRTTEVFLQIADFCKLLTVFPPTCCVCVCVCVCAQSCLTFGNCCLPGSSVYSTRFSRQEYWSGLPFPPPRNLPNPGIKPASPVLAGRFFTTEPPGNFLLHIAFLCMNANFSIFNRHLGCSQVFTVSINAMNMLTCTYRCTCELGKFRRVKLKNHVACLFKLLDVAPLSCLWLIIVLYLSGCHATFPGGSDSKESTCNAGDLGSVPG